MSKTTTAAGLYRTLQLLSEELGGTDAPLSLALSYLRVAMAGDAGIDQGQLQRELKLANSTISRIKQTLGPVHYLKDRDGLNLVDSTIDPTNLRLRTLKLNAKGKRALAKVLGGR